MVYGYVLLFLLDLKLENRKNRCLMLDYPVTTCREIAIQLAVAVDVFDGFFFVLSCFPRDVLDEIWD